jgi:hypothetical protein
MVVFMRYHPADTTTSISSDGTRYLSKEPGTPFTTVTEAIGATMSCYMCGKHALRQLGAFRRLIGVKRFVCQEHAGNRLAQAS